MYSDYFPGVTSTSMLIVWIMVALAIILFKGLALWQSARHSQKWWFIALLILNTIGILPLIYLFFFRPDRKKTNIFGQKLKRKRKR
jgi:hypothetical protein